jgi:D-3-phosphoglycerate dehydrogenase
MKVLVADRFEAIGVEGLQALGCEVIVDPHLSGESLREALKSHRPEVLVVRSTEVTAEMIQATRTLELVVRAGAGVNTIDVDTASRHGVYVTNCPGMNSAAVAELVFGLIISLDRRIAHNVSELREGVWNKKEYSKARGLKGSTLGIVGLGNVGQHVAQRAAAFEMRGVYFDPVDRGAFAERYNLERLSLDELLKQSDYVTLHVPLIEETRHLINEKSLRLMKPSAILINTSRGEVVDEAALGKALDEGWIAGAGLDVYEHEPAGASGQFGDPVTKFKELYGTHHIGASTAQAQTAVATETVRIVRTYLESGRAPNCVNTTDSGSATHVLIVRHLNKPGILAHVLGHLNEAHINVEEMSNLVFRGAESCCAHIHLSAPPADKVLAAIRGHALVLSARLVRLGGIS